MQTSNDGSKRALRRVAVAAVRRLPLTGVRNLAFEIPTYAAALVPWQRTHRKFIIFGQGRSGSTLLVDLLNSSPDVRCEDEILRFVRRLPTLYVKGRAARADAPVFGFHLKIWHLTDTQGIPDAPTWLRLMHRDGWNILYLRRENLLRQSLSAAVAKRRQRWFHEATAGPLRLEPVEVDPQELVYQIRRKEQFLRAEAQALADIPHLEVVYERDLLHGERHQETADRVFDWIGARRATVRTRLARTSTDDLSQMIDNYDKVSKVIREHGYERFLDKAGS